MSISINEINTVGDLEIEEDNNTVDGHSVVDYTNIISLTKVKKKVKKTKNTSVARGWTPKKQKYSNHPWIV